jgi:ATP phosphoribosyltransferase regulatory subunit
MTGNAHWILPQGIEEALPQQAIRLEHLRRKLLDLYAGWGYRLVIPPFIDHLESLLTGTGHDLDLQTFKLVDQVSGRSLGLRADMTPQVARIDAHQLQREAPTRLCYIGTVLRALPDSFGGSRSPLQVGAELYGHAGVESEVEILDLMLQTFQACGIDDVYLDLGNVDIFKNLSLQAGLDEHDESRLFELLQRKAVADIETLLTSLSIDSSLQKMIAGLTGLNGGLETIERARELLEAAGGNVNAAIDYLEQVAISVSRHNRHVNLVFDLAELHGYHYQTGVVFAAFVPQLGTEIARGGRYDDIGRIFGRSRAATGFSTDLKILAGLSACDVQLPPSVCAPPIDDAALAAKINELRAAGYSVMRLLPGQIGDAAAMACDHELRQVGGHWQLFDTDY